jgi:hypothetical protein
MPDEMPVPSPRIELVAPAASPQEAAAIVAALERFMRDTAPAGTPRPDPPDRWREAAILESVRRDEQVAPTDPWINT